MPQQNPVDYAKLASQHGGVRVSQPAAPAVDYAALARDVNQPTPPMAAAPVRADTGGVSGLLREFWQRVNPVEMVKGLNQAVTHPIDTAKAIGAAQSGLFDKAQASAEAGDYVNASRHFINYLLPLIGPDIDNAGNLMGEGRIAEGVGASLGIGTAISGPAALKNVRSMPVTPKFANPNPAEVEAVKFARSQGVPVDAATASGQPAVRIVQGLAERSLAGSNIGTKARYAQGEQLARVGDDLAARAHPTAVSTIQAGEGVSNAVLGKVRQFAGEADTAYSGVRKIEADPKFRRTVQVGTEKLPDGTTKPVMEDMALPVDLRGAKSQLRPIYDRLMKQYPVAQQEASKGLKALGNIVNGPDFMPLSEADFNLGAIKTIARTDVPELRTLSQGTAAGAVKALEAVVSKTAQDAGAFKALRAGRDATIAKFKAGEVLDAISAEPVRAFNRAVSGGDSAIAQLREVAKLAPDELPKIGRAYLDGLMAKATSEGGFGHTAKIYADWTKLGPDTKKLLFKDPGHVADLDNFFLFAKKSAENPNPSGSGYTAAATAAGMMWIEPLSGAAIQITAAALAKGLWNPRFVKVLTEGFRVPLGNKAAAVTATAQMLKLAKESGVQLAGDGSDRSPQRTGR